ncbi:RING/U-box superfamily protein [Euphorbia peplus]|nr:RING/U-box superfamily protein [Euphorbia peplus]
MATTSYWCYRCTQSVAVSIPDENTDAACPNCHGGFIEQIQTNSNSNSNSQSQIHNPHNRFMHMLSGVRNTQDSDRIPAIRFRRNRRNSGDHPPINPVVVLRGAAAVEDTNEEESSYLFYYDDGTGSGLRPVPAGMSEFLMGSGFDRLLEQLAQIEVNGLGRVGNPPASKAVVEALPTVEIKNSHLHAEEHCAVCKEAFEIGGEAREMPCKHIYHSDCILPWLAMRNSCPVCRHELAAEVADHQESEGSEVAEAEEIVGLTIWRLPGGGFAVGRFSGGRRGGEREFPGVFTEMDGGFSGEAAAVAVPRRVSWVSRTSRRRDRNGNGGLRRVFSGLISLFRRRIGSNSNSNPSTSSSIDSGFSSMSRSSSQSSSGFGRYVTRRRRGLDLEVENGTDRW